LFIAARTRKLALLHSVVHRASVKPVRGSTGSLERMPYQFDRLSDRERE
jgi:hypothetical protein